MSDFVKGLFRQDATRNRTKQRTREFIAREVISAPKGYSSDPIYCEACKKFISIPSTRQRFCDTCRIAYQLGLNRNPHRPLKIRAERLKNPYYDEYLKKRNRVNAAKRDKRLNRLFNKRCECGIKIHFESKHCRSCAAKKRPHPRKFFTCQLKECSSQHLAKGYCDKHYQQFRKNKLKPSCSPITD